MTHRFIYPDVITEIRAVCSEHLAGQVSADKVQRTVQRTEYAIVAIFSSIWKRSWNWSGLALMGMRKDCGRAGSRVRS
ncbi:hypothetical protein [Komagataeibacter sp. FXV3]|uniref:hypothetical protein n=1 Tax=Komagataeibacter sp. FXV3 TaxID=2608998 RepID=UPI00187BBBBB|nr:hypothetical protein [Komagataeibacter sp. FXV3]MBE7729725.1 hypothetical protein [Komagataeibacter sp. FXV3]